MNKKIIYSLLVIVFLLTITGCQKNNQNNNINTKEETNYESNLNNYNEEIQSMKIFINNKEYIIALENNETSNALVAKLPLEFNMSELNGNEKYIYIDDSLPTNSSNPKHINAGDVMLYGDNCLVIFYKSFDTSYSYTKIGHINNLPNLGNGSIQVKIEK